MTGIPAEAIAAGLAAGTLRLCNACHGSGQPPAGWLAARYCPTCGGTGIQQTPRDPAPLPPRNRPWP